MVLRTPTGRRGGQDEARASFESRDEMHSIGRAGPRPHAHKTFRIREHDRAPMHQRSHTGWWGTLGTQGTIEVRPIAPKGTRRKLWLDIRFPSI